MKELKVRLVEEYRGNVNPERKYHLYDIKKQSECVQNLTKEEVEPIIKKFKLTLVK